MKVYLLMHEDGLTGDPCGLIRGVYATREAAMAALPIEYVLHGPVIRITKVRHDAMCCTVDERDVESGESSSDTPDA